VKTKDVAVVIYYFGSESNGDEEKLRKLIDSLDNINFREKIVTDDTNSLKNDYGADIVTKYKSFKGIDRSRIIGARKTDAPYILFLNFCDDINISNLTNFILAANGVKNSQIISIKGSVKNGERLFSKDFVMNNTSEDVEGSIDSVQCDSFLTQGIISFPISQKDWLSLLDGDNGINTIKNKINANNYNEILNIIMDNVAYMYVTQYYFHRFQMNNKIITLTIIQK
jgi:hypothetical protein